jgi:hypothetical protein
MYERARGHEQQNTGPRVHKQGHARRRRIRWLAPRLEAAGYTVFADILTLEPGDRWRRQVTYTLQNKAVKMLLCCRDVTLNKNGVQEEIGIAEDLVKELKEAKRINTRLALRINTSNRFRFPKQRVKADW